MRLNSKVPFPHQKERVLRLWRAIEASLPQAASDAKPGDKEEPAYRIDLAPSKTKLTASKTGSGHRSYADRVYDLPWHDSTHISKFLPGNKEWSYRLECGLYKTSVLADLLKDRIGGHADVFDDRAKEQRSRLFDLAFNAQGIPIADTFTLSLACWSAGQILKYNNGIEVMEMGGRLNIAGLPGADADIQGPMSGYSAFDELCRRIMQWLRDEAEQLKQAERPPDRAWLHGLILAVARRCLLPEDLTETTCLAKCVPVRKTPQSDSDKAPPAQSTDDMLNSFFIEDLGLLANRWRKRDVGAGLLRFMTGDTTGTAARIDLRDSAADTFRLAAISPQTFPAGRWPSDYPLAFSQQLAVNQIFKRLSAANAAGLFSINGPPGTGKTTLLRDVVAAVVTERAIALVESNNKLFRKRKSKKLGEQSRGYHELADAIRGTSIVVASANNGAVENISMELPGATAVPERVRAGSDYFSVLAARVLDDPAWGLLAARLGNKKNRKLFLDRFWWGEPDADDQRAPAANAQPDGMGKDEGLLHHLKAIKAGDRQPALSLNDAKTRFQRARIKEADLRRSLIDASTIPDKINVLKVAETTASRKRDEVHARIAALQTSHKTLDGDLSERLNDRKVLEAHYQDCANERDRAQANRPGLLLWLASLGRSHRDWAERLNRLEADHYQARQDLAHAIKTIRRSEQDLQEVRHSLASEQAQLLGCTRQIEQLAQARTELQRRLARVSTDLEPHWPDLAQEDSAVEQSSPWSTPEWRDAREAVFLAALDLHRAFIEAHPSQVMTNLILANAWLDGQPMPEALAQLALDSLCLVVPVISTAFPSVSRMFKPMGREAIGWLLIDEAGQALPQQAAGAIWRAKRTVVVGDPKQLEPVCTIPPNVEGAFAAYYDNVSRQCWPSETSVQCMADQSMDIGTSLPGPDNDPIWIGCPLRVHRRCDAPMFEISNHIAYDDMMVQGKPTGSSPLPVSQWFDVQSETGEGHWVPEEKTPLKGLIDSLTTEHAVDKTEIFVISPFRDVATRLKRTAKSLGLDWQKVGTVHTAQGKEARVVIVVLGGNPSKPGAKGWAASKPNLLNVAVSRAKERLYVIGNRREWAAHPYFSDLAHYVRQEKAE